MISLPNHLKIKEWDIESFHRNGFYSNSHTQTEFFDDIDLTVNQEFSRPKSVISSRTSDMNYIISNVSNITIQTNMFQPLRMINSDNELVMYCDAFRSKYRRSLSDNVCEELLPNDFYEYDFGLGCCDRCGKKDIYRYGLCKDCAKIVCDIHNPLREALSGYSHYVESVGSYSSPWVLFDIIKKPSKEITKFSIFKINLKYWWSKVKFNYHLRRMSRKNGQSIYSDVIQTSFQRQLNFLARDLS